MPICPLVGRSPSALALCPPVRARSKTNDLTGSIELAGGAMSFLRNCEIYGEGESADYLYKVVSGAVRTCRFLGDGRRHIGAFYLPGDIFGLEANDEHQLSAEAISDSTIVVAKRSALITLAACESDIVRQLWTSTAQELERVQHHMLLLVKSAQERVASFLMEMAERLPMTEAMELPMSRQDIADYLGLTIETVSRSLTRLQTRAAIALPTSRRIVVRNRAALSRLNA